MTFLFKKKKCGQGCVLHYDVIVHEQMQVIW